TNAHVVLEEAPAPARSAAGRSAQLIVLSAKTPAALDQATSALAGHLRAHPEVPLADVAWSLGVGRQAFQHRRAVVVRDASQALEVLANPGRPPVLTGAFEGGERPVAFLFSGQGSQYAGMGAGLYREEGVYRDAIDRCAALLQPHLELDIRTAMFAAKGDAAVDETRLTQPALFATEYALASLWMSWGIVPKAMLGHSIGEYVAAHLAGVMSLEDALRVVAARGRLMQAQPPGSMAAISLPAPELETLLADGVEIAAVNAPSLCTVSGPSAAIERLVERLQGRGVEVRALRTSHAFHSAMMEPALAPLVDVLRGVALAPPKIPYASNLTGTWITPEQATSAAYYADHLRGAVRFEAGARALAANPAMLLLEVGPGNALTSLARLTIGKDGARRALSSLPHPRETRPDLETVLEAAGRLWLAGVSLDWKHFQAEAASRRVPLPTYPFERKRFWVDAAPPVPAAAHGEGPRPSSSVDDWLYAPTWTRDDSVDARAPHLEHAWLVLAPPGPLGDAVARQVKAASAAPVLVETGERFERLEATRFRVRPGSEEDRSQLVQEVRRARGAIGGAIVRWSTAGAAATGWSTGGSPVARNYHSLVALAAALDPSLDGAVAHADVTIIAATCGAESVLDEPVRNPEAAMVVGPVIVLPTEVPGLRLRAVDVAAVDGSDAVDSAARQLVAEAAAVDGERLVAWRADRRWVRRFERLSLPPAEPSALPLKPRGVYLITGGLGGIGSTIARWLAGQCAARLVLTARTPLPGRETWDAWLAGHGPDDKNAATIRAIRDIEQAGGEVLVAAAGAADEQAMRRAVEQARARWGAIDGVVHAAGVPGTGGIAFRKGPDDVDAVLQPKIDGLAVLIRLLGDSKLDFVALFSSINSVLGAPGVCDYASANAVLDAFADSASRPAGWGHVVAFDWGPWREVGMAATLVVPEGLRKDRDAMMRYAISPAAGAEAFARVLASGRRRVVVTPFDPSRTVMRARGESSGSKETAAPSEVATPTAAQARPDISSAYEAPATDTERVLAGIWSELLGVEQVGVHDNFFELGGHSLLATRVLARIDLTLKARLTLRDIFDAPTIHGLSGKVRSKVVPTSPSAAEGDGEREEIEF
ncbi:MAG TPA: SDR family NAD(P)-dependent oxidoreductase, partial [Polyangiaceae bacterium]|nr:SDR family NAD(P)-dependent oxidoreductase [Polyangiaceae bacterium]